MTILHLTVSAHGLGVVSLPLGSVRTTNGVVGTVTLDSQTTMLAASRSQTTAFAVLVDGVADPVDTRIVSDVQVAGVNNNNFVVLESSVLVNPIRVQDTHVSVNTTNSLLGNRTKVSGKFKLVDTLVLGLTVDNTSVVRALSTTTTNSGTNNSKTLHKNNNKTIIKLN